MYIRINSIWFKNSHMNNETIHIHTYQENLEIQNLAGFSLSFFFLWPCLEACRIFVSPPGIKPMPQHWTGKKFPKSGRFKRKEETKAKISMPKGFQENERQMTKQEKISITHIIIYYHVSSHYVISSYHSQ